MLRILHTRRWDAPNAWEEARALRSPGLDGKIQHLKPTEGNPLWLFIHGTAQVRPPIGKKIEIYKGAAKLRRPAYSGTLCQRKSLAAACSGSRPAGSPSRARAARRWCRRRVRSANFPTVRQTTVVATPDGLHTKLRAHLFCVTLSPRSPKAVPPLSNAFAFRRSSQASLLRMTI